MDSPASVKTSRSAFFASGLFVLLLLPLLGGCITDMKDDPVSRNPDHRIVVAPIAPGSKTLKAYPPECPSWAEHRPAYDDNMPQPQIGCATQRNLALTIDEPADLVEGRKLGKQDATRAASNMKRYHDDKAKGLYDPTQLPAPKE
ncbi:MAG: CpaD family pilus assembly lipoprotein [Alphaproteobacteria bacterium]